MAVPVVILGAGGFARETLDVFDACNRERPGTWDVLGFLSEVTSEWGGVRSERPVLGGLEYFDRAGAGVRAICGIGAPAIRRRIVDDCLRRGVAFTTVVHPQATVTDYVRVGAGCVITAGVVLTNGIVVGDHVHLNLNTTVGHDTTIEAFSTIAPGVNVSGNVRVGTGCAIGTGTAIIERATIGEWAVVGAGTVVVRDVPPNVTVVGVPARVTTTRPAGWWRDA